MDGRWSVVGGWIGGWVVDGRMKGVGGGEDGCADG